MYIFCEAGGGAGVIKLCNKMHSSAENIFKLILIINISKIIKRY